MSVTAPTRPRGPAIPRRPSARAAAGVAVALALTTPLLAATVWTRANATGRMPKGSRVPLEDVSYAARDWSAALTAVEVRSAAGRADGSGEVATTWTFHYTNTDKAPHYVALAIRCLDGQRKERSSFKVLAVLLADQPGGAKVDLTVRMREADWDQAAWAKVVADFLSGPAD